MNFARQRTGMITRNSGQKPVPLASDSFNRANGALGETDGAGVPDYPGGADLTWVASQGTAAIATNVANPTAAPSSVCIQTVDVAQADVVVSAECSTNGVGLIGIALRYVDSNNYIIAYHTGVNINLRKRVGGTLTALVNVAATYVAGAEILVATNGTKFRLFYNGVMIGAEQTVEDAALQSSTLHGVYSSGIGSALVWDNFAAWAWADYNELAA